MKPAPATARLRVLHLEDDLADAELVAAAFAAEVANSEITHVTSRAGFERALAGPPPDIVLSDYSLPGYDGMAALAALRAIDPDLPFVLITGTIGEERAADALRGGATDVVLKQRLERLGPVVRRALAESAQRRRSRELAEQLRQAQKMEAVGQLTGGIAHDFNNLLTVMLTSAELVRTGLHPDQAELYADLDALLAAGARGTEMIRKLLGFSRRRPLELRSLAVGPLVSELADTLQRLLPAHIAIRTSVVEPVSPVEADPGSLEQMVLNLATNARDAMPEGGTLALEVREVVRAKGDASDGSAIGGRYVCLAVRDSGVGMTEEVKSRVFEPFFTTKPAGLGTGLGMAMIYGLARQQRGFVEVDSTPGEGTEVRLFLPVARRPAEVAGTPAPARRSGETRHTATILVADDEPSLRRATRRVLESMGYRVVTAEDGRQALAALMVDPAGIDLVITDQMMPEFTGSDLYREARAAGITAPFLVTSGYATEDLADKGFGPEVRRLNKPWTIQELGAAVRASLKA